MQVIVSMGTYAASGGYFISAPATRIVAQPTTITGSIGVLFGKLNLAGGLQQVPSSKPPCLSTALALGLEPPTCKVSRARPHTGPTWHANL